MHRIVSEYESTFGINATPPRAFFRSADDAQVAERLRWLEANVPDRVIRACRFPIDFDITLSDEEDRLRHWLQTGLYPLSVAEHAPAGSLSPCPPLPVEEVPSALGAPHRTAACAWWAAANTQRLRAGPPDAWGRRTWWHVYVVPRGTMLYHGTSGAVTAPQVLKRGNYFAEWFVATHYFAVDYQEHHPDGGRVYAYETTDDVELIALDSAHNIRILRSLSAFRTPEMRRRLRIAFPTALADGRTVRHYGSANDLRIMSVLCGALGANGVASLSVPSDTAQHRAVVHTDTNLDVEGSHDVFPPEIYLCDPRRWLRWRADLICEPWQVFDGSDPSKQSRRPFDTPSSPTG